MSIMGCTGSKIDAVAVSEKRSVMILRWGVGGKSDAYDVFTMIKRSTFTRKRDQFNVLVDVSYVFL